MSRPTLHTLIGLCLFVSGLIAIYAVSSPRPAGAVGEPLPDPAVTPEQSDRIDGVGPAVEQALSTEGKVGTFDSDELSQIPSEVAQALLQHGVTLTVRSGGGR